MIRDVAIAMAAAHREGVIHRDLKPSNIVVTHEGVPVVIDFGLALVMDDPGPRLTEPGMFIGTRAFAAPEQLHGDTEDHGPHSDVFALGCILYEQLARRLPFPTPRRPFGPDPNDAPPVSPSTHRVEVDPELDTICLKALAPRPQDRYTSMEEFAADLEAFLEETRLPQPLRVRAGCKRQRSREIAPSFLARRSGSSSRAPARRRRSVRHRTGCTWTSATTFGSE